MAHFDLLIRGATLLDGTGAPPRPDDLGVVGERIAAIGAIPGDATAARLIDARGRALCPGFIDVHSHSDVSLLLDPRGESKVHQGVTTEVIGNCGFSAFPLALPERRQQHLDLLASLGTGTIEPTWSDLEGYRAAFAQRGGTALNLAPQVGHGTLRIAVMGMERRPPTVEELERMQWLLAQALEQGAFGLASGLTYPPSGYADTEELIALSRVVARFGGHYATHARAETEGFGHVEEAVRIGRESGARVQFSHLALNVPARWGRHADLLRLFEHARERGVDIAYDVYPYAASSSCLTQYLPGWVQAGGPRAMAERLRDPGSRARARADVAAGWFGGIPWLWDRVVISRSGDPHDTASPGKTLQALAVEAGVPPEELVLRLCETRGNAVEVVLFYRTEEDVQAFLRHPLSTVGSDGLALPRDQGEARPHPRSFGAFPRVLGRYVRELGLLDLATAVHKMTGRAAERVGLRDRGRLAEGLAADLVLFDPARVADRATFAEPCQLPAGIDLVVVNGHVVIDGGRQTKARPGRVLRRGE